MFEGLVRRALHARWAGVRGVSRAAAAAAVGGASLLAGGVASATGTAGPEPSGLPTAIKHVVVVLEENHSFDNLFGQFCREVADKQIVRPGAGDGCDGATKGKTQDGGTIPLASAPDFVPPSNHTVQGQQVDIDGGKMDGFSSSVTCGADLADCYIQFDPLSGPCALGTCIPNISALATRYAVSDRTFELRSSASWAGHLVFAAATQDGFYGDNPRPSAVSAQAQSTDGGWGCDSNNTTQMYNALRRLVTVPSCVPTSSGSLGPNWVRYAGPRVNHVPTIFGRLRARGLSWRLYGGAGRPVGTKAFQNSGWQWTICPSFAGCLDSHQRQDLVPASDVLTDARQGRLPSFSIVTPTAADSQHNGFLMDEGDDFIGQVVSAVQSGRDWPSTAVFVTYDDCGCFYDHVSPLPYSQSWGVRVPMVIVSPFVKEGYTDSHPTSFAGILAFTEHLFGLAPLDTMDAHAYDFNRAFCLHPARTHCVEAGLRKVPMVDQRPPSLTAAQRAEQRAQAAQDT